MNHYHRAGQGGALPRKTAILAFWISIVTMASGTSNVVLWDTSVPMADTLATDDRTSWKAVPGDLLRLEADPPKASSDPGYYGREYVFRGDAIVESPSLAAVFWSAKGRVLIYAKEESSGGAQTSRGLGRKLAEIYPLEAKAGPMTISQLTVLRNTGDELALEAGFSAGGATEVSEAFVFDRTKVVEIKPAKN